MWNRLVVHNSDENIFAESQNLLGSLVRSVAKACTEETDRRVVDQIVGSTITGITMEPISNRKTMYELVITTTVGEVEIPKVSMRGDLRTPTGHIDCSEIRVRVKRK